MGKKELVTLLNLFSWCLVMDEWLFRAMPRGCLRFVIVVFPDHTHLLFLTVRQLRPKFRCGSRHIDRRMAENGFAHPPPLGNVADISYLVEN